MGHKEIFFSSSDRERKIAKNRVICAAHTCIPQYREYPPPGVYHFVYPQFLFLPDITTKINSFDDLKKNRHFFIKSTVDVT